MLPSVLLSSTRRANLSALLQSVHHGRTVNFTGLSGIDRCHWKHTRSFSSTSKVAADVIEEKIFPTDKIRNIAIIAHGSRLPLFGVNCAGC
jgi:hypothetical protein